MEQKFYSTSDADGESKYVATNSTLLCCKLTLHVIRISIALKPRNNESKLEDVNIEMKQKHNPH